MNLMIEISIYIFVAILLGYFFGWLITKLLLKEKYQTHLDKIILSNNADIEEINEIKDELLKYKNDNKRLKVQNKEFSLGYDGQKYVVDEDNITLNELEKRLYAKDDVIASLTTKLSLTEERQLEIEKKYEEEIDAFMFERIDITQKYKNLLKDFTSLEADKGVLREKNSWFSKFFSSPSA